MKKIFRQSGGVILATILLLPLRSAPSDPASAVQWTENYPEALARAKQEHKPVLLDFTGSDWCIWCKRLHEEVLSQTPFADYARDHLILVELDYPQDKTQTEELKKQNAKLSEQFSVTGYPTIVMVDAEGKELGRTGYMQGGAKTFVRELKRFASKATVSAPPKAQ
jgi:thioredoxin-related protein